MLGMKDELGTIEAGKLADLLVINGDPVKDITLLQNRANLDVVMKDGKLVDCKLTPGKSVAKAA
jgi:imidazolonepropionase-like amidohydrolase